PRLGIEVARYRRSLAFLPRCPCPFSWVRVTARTLSSGCPCTTIRARDATLVEADFRIARPALLSSRSRILFMSTSGLIEEGILGTDKNSPRISYLAFRQSTGRLPKIFNGHIHQRIKSDAIDYPREPRAAD